MQAAVLGSSSCFNANPHTCADKQPLTSRACWLYAYAQHTASLPVTYELAYLDTVCMLAICCSCVRIYEKVAGKSDISRTGASLQFYGLDSLNKVILGEINTQGAGRQRAASPLHVSSLGI